MPKFSIIIPVYNVEKYIGKCLESVFNQTYKDYEVIVVNDGTKDNSMDIVKKYPVKIIEQKNQGLSAARNTGEKKAKGEYIIFLDSDDYWDKDLLKKISKSLDNNPDIVRFQVRSVNEDNEKIDYPEEEFENLSGEEAFNRIVKFHFVENAWCYAIKKKYYDSQKFSFRVGTIHEDYGLTPLIIIKASTVNCINYIGYNYLQRQGSIINTKNYERTKKKVEDCYIHYKYLIQEIEKVKVDKKVFKSFVANTMLLKITELNDKDYKEYKKKLKNDKIYDNLLTNTLSRKIKKLFVMLSPKMYYRKKK